jgi:hypothetical protein
MNHKLPPARILLWAHISGYPSPNNFTDYIINFPNKVIFTTPLSFNSPEIQSLSMSKRSKIGTIWSTAGVERILNFTKNSEVINKKNNIVGYTGNLDYTKLNSNFLSANEKIKLKDAEFIVIGPPTKQFVEDYEKSSVKKRMKITGFVLDLDLALLKKTPFKNTLFCQMDLTMVRCLQ